MPADTGKTFKELHAARFMARAVDFLRAETHTKECAYMTSGPMMGDEASLCDCGAVERAYEAWVAAGKPDDRPHAPPCWCGAQHEYTSGDPRGAPPAGLLIKEGE